MDIKSETAVTFMKIVSDVHLSFLRLAGGLRSQGEVVNIDVGFNCLAIPREEPPTLTAYVDVTLDDDRTFSWLLEIAHVEGRWSVEPSVRESQEYGQMSIIEFSNRRSEAFDELAQLVEEASADLFNSAKTFQFAKHNDEMSQL